MWSMTVIDLRLTISQLSTYTNGLRCSQTLKQRQRAMEGKRMKMFYLMMRLHISYTVYMVSDHLVRQKTHCLHLMVLWVFQSIPHSGSSKVVCFRADTQDWMELTLTGVLWLITFKCVHIQ